MRTTLTCITALLCGLPLAAQADAQLAGVFGDHMVLQREAPIRVWGQASPGETVQVQFSWPIGKPLVDHLGEAVWEVRSRLKDRIARTLFAVHEQEIVLLHGFIKKDRKTPKEDLRLARKRRTLYVTGYEQE